MRSVGVCVNTVDVLKESSCWSFRTSQQPTSFLWAYTYFCCSPGQLSVLTFALNLVLVAFSWFSPTIFPKSRLVPNLWLIMLFSTIWVNDKGRENLHILSLACHQLRFLYSVSPIRSGRPGRSGSSHPALVCLLLAQCLMLRLPATADDCWF